MISPAAERRIGDARLSGIHHLSIPVTDLQASLAWFQKALHGSHIERFDHRDGNGVVFAVIVELPGDGPLLELRRDAELARSVAGFTPISFGVGTRAGLDQWLHCFDSAGVAHSPVTQRRVGESTDVETPDGLVLRFYTDPVGGFREVTFDEQPTLSEQRAQSPDESTAS